jgi:chemotaxis family two-component system response regulator PixG
MDNVQVMELIKLIKEFNLCKQFKYTGQLHINNDQGKSWNFYYQRGQIVWVTGGTHPYRRWLRNITQHCPAIDISKIQYSSDNILIDYWDYILLENLYLRNKIRQEQIDNIVESTISEILFDLSQQMYLSSLSFEKNETLILKSSLSYKSRNILFKTIQEYWENWQDAGLKGISPYLAPVLNNPQQLQNLVSPLVYSNLQRLLTGDNTLWDLALKMNKSVLQISLSLLPYIKKGIIGLIELPDLPLPADQVSQTSQVKEKNNTHIPLIACVDDSIQVCQMLERIIISHGMRFVGVQHPLQALPILLESKPDLIFLDLMMPVVNGYEVCEQLRRCSQFAKTPIVILTGSDGVFDRVRSKVFGATEFVTKPVETDKVMRVVNKYLQSENKENHFPHWVFSF